MPIKRVFDPRDHHNAKWTFTNQAHKNISHPSSMVLIFSKYNKYDIWNGYSTRFWHYFRSWNYRMINIWRLSWPIFCWKSFQNPAYNREQCFLSMVDLAVKHKSSLVWLVRYQRRCFKLWYFFTPWRASKQRKIILRKMIL